MQAPRAPVWPVVLGGVSGIYGLLLILHSIARFVHAAFGPVIPGPAGDRPPIAPVQLRYEIALESIFVFAMAVVLLCAASALIRRQRGSISMLGFWAVATLLVQAIFYAWSMLLEEQRLEYLAMATAWREHALQNPIGIARPFGRYEMFIEGASHATRWIAALPFIYPVIVGLIALLPGVRNEAKTWK